MIFKKRVFGKFVLGGEYSVLRSGPAIVYPLKPYYIDFKYQNHPQALSLKKGGRYRTGLDFTVTPVLHKAFKILGKSQEKLKGSLSIEGQIPFGAGLGASASLCLGIAHLFLHKKWIKKTDLAPFAIQLEDIFHGKSSGMDISVVLKEKPILYQKGKVLKYLEPFKQEPLLFLSYSEGRASTSVGVAKVRKLFDKNWELGESIDKQMNQSVQLCLKALSDKKNMLSHLKSALDLAEDCFQQWGLISYDLKQHIQELKQAGALAVKPTGSGLGGHVISLWNKALPAKLKKKLQPLKV